LLIPETPKQHNDLVDIVVEAAQVLKEVTLPDGTTQLQQVINSKIIWWKTQIVAKPTFGRFAKELEDFGALSQQAEYFMSKPRAAALSKQIMLEIEGYERSIDATSSISRLDRNNTQPTLVDKINSSKVPRYYSLKEDAKKSLLEGLFGGKKKDDDV